jgi:hypothetical protein
MTRVRSHAIAFTLGVLLLAFSGSGHRADAGPFGAFIGEFHVVTARRAFDVSGGPEDASADAAIGATVIFADELTWLDGTQCETWSAVESEDQVVDLKDPLLSDLTVGISLRRGSYLARARARSGNWLLTCDDRVVGAARVVDERVLVVPSPGGLSNLILERPLDAELVGLIQDKLRELGYYDGATTGDLDDATRRAVALRAHELGADYSFAIGVVTQALLLDLTG